MKRFLYGRMYHREHGWYISPGIDMGDFGSVIPSIETEAGAPKILLQRYNGNILFGVREQLTLRDAFNRPRMNFLGYRLEGPKPANQLPFFDALREEFSKITAEAHACHTELDKNPNAGQRLREPTTRFNAGTFTQGNAWDEAVMKLRQGPGDMLMMFDQHGNSLESQLQYALEANRRNAPKQTGLPQEKKAPAKVAPSLPSDTPSASIGKGKMAIIGAGAALLGVIGYWVFTTMQREKEPEHQRTTPK